MLKYFRGLGLPQKYITTNIYTRMKYYVRKMEDYTRDLCICGTRSTSPLPSHLFNMHILD